MIFQNNFISARNEIEIKSNVLKWIECSPENRYIFGKSEICGHILDNYSVAAIVDDETMASEFKGTPILKSSQIPVGSLVLSSIIGRVKTARMSCTKHNFVYIDYYSFYKFCDNHAIKLRFWDEVACDYATNRNKYIKLYESLADDESRKTLAAVLSFRLSCDINYMLDFNDNQNHQYFEDFLELSADGEVFVDVGGYDGFTSEEFIKHCPGYEAIHIFEPDPISFKNVCNKFDNLRNININQCALGAETRIRGFASCGSKGHIDENGGIKIKEIALDDLFLQKATFVKMDIEGGEVDAINGAKDLIKKLRPRLAVAAYHKVNDLWKINEIVQKLMRSKVYLRHYTEGLDETIMFFVPI